MAPRPYWKGYLKLSLVACPVVLYPATTQADKTRFHMINKRTGNRLQQQMVDAETGDVVEKDDKGRGYQLGKGRYVEMEEGELDAVKIESTHTIEIDSFVPKDDIDERYLNKPYYIAPDGKAALEPYVVIQSAMEDEGRVALGRIVLANREHILAIEPLGKGLVGTTLHYDHEMRDEKDYFSDIKAVKIPKEMRELASHILATKAGRFDPSKFKDRYETALKTLVKRKAAGKPIQARAPEATSNVVNLMDALRQSVEGGTGRTKKASRRPKARKKPGRKKAA